MDNNTNNSNDKNVTIIPDVLLSVAKDNRYIKLLTFLLSQTIHPYLPLYTPTTNDINATSTTITTNNDNNTSNQSPSLLSLKILQPELKFIARFIHAFIIWKDKEYHSIGQESLSLHHHQNITTTSKQTNRNQTKNKLIFFLCLYTLSPYLIQRIGQRQTDNIICTNNNGIGDGWNEINMLIREWRNQCHQLIQSLSQYISSGHVNHNSNNNNNNNNNTTTNSRVQDHIFNNTIDAQTCDTVHGMERRRIYDEMRRRMLERANALEQTDQLLQQQQRVYVQPLQPPQPLDQQQPSRSNYPLNNDHNNQQQSSSQPNYFSTLHIIALRRKLLSWTKIVLQSIHEATLSSSPIAHEYNDNTGSNTLTNHNATFRNNTMNHNPQPRHTQVQQQQIIDYNKYLTSIIKWMIRLNLALFYANGKYPSIIHRLTGVNVALRDDHQQRVLGDRPSYKPICYLILLQSCAQLVKGIANISLDIRDHYKLQRTRRQLRNEQQGDGGRGSSDDAILTLGGIERYVPSFKSFSDTTNHEINHTRVRRYVQCGICLNDRKCPAVPRNCGHVFCWECIQRWIATVRPECPLCRAPSKAQEVIALYNYSPS